MTVAERSAGRRRFLQFSLLQMFLLVTVLAVLASVVSWRMEGRRKKRALAAANRYVTEAAKLGDLEGVKASIAAGADQYRRRFAFRAAVENNQVAVARYLLESYPEYRGGGVPATLCSRPGSKEMLELLFQYGARAHPTNLIAAIEIDLTPEAKSQMVGLLISHGADVDAALCYAAAHRDVPLAEAAWQYGAHFDARVFAELGMLDDLALAVAEDPSLLDKRFAEWSSDGYLGDKTLLSIALERADREMACFLLDAGAPVDATVFNSDTLLFSAAVGGDPELVRLLIGRGLNPNTRDGDLTPLELAIRNDHVEAAAALIDGGADVNARGYSTPLIDAAMTGGGRSVQLLLDAGADPSLADANGRTAHDLARVRKNPAILRLLEQKAEGEKANAVEASDADRK